jgi:hypothetical protein
MLLAGGLLAAVLLPALVAVTAVSVEQAQVGMRGCCAVTYMP